MKKLILAAVLALTLFSCKKEKCWECESIINGQVSYDRFYGLSENEIRAIEITGTDTFINPNALNDTIIATTKCYLVND